VRHVPRRLRTLLIAVMATASAAFVSQRAAAQTCSTTSFPYTLTNGTTADASQVMANLNCAAIYSLANWTGNVGINNTNPIAPLDLGGGGYLHVAGSANPTVTAQGAYLNWNLTNGGGETDFINNKGGGAGGFSFLNNTALASPLMFIAGSGNVGIGTANPLGQLSLSSAGPATFNVGITTNATGAVAQVINSLYVVGNNASTLASNGAVAWNYFNGGNNPSYSGALLEFFGTSYSGSANGMAAANQGALVFQNVNNGVIATNGANLTIAPVNTPIATFMSTGVGVGVQSSGAELAVYGNGTNMPALSVTDSSSGFDNSGSYGMVNLTRNADTTKAHLAFIRNGNFVWQLGYVNNTNTFGIFPWNFSGTQGTPTIAFSGSAVGIGTAAPNAPLEVIGGAINFANSTSLGYGSLWADSWLHIAADNTTGQTLTLSSQNGIYLRPTYGGTSVTYFNTAASTSYINSTGGNVGIGTTSPAYPLYVNGEAGGTTNWVNASDGRLKTGVAPISDALALVQRLRGVRFRWRTPEEREVGKQLTLPSDQPQLGFIAQEVAEVVPEAVTVPKDAVAASVDGSKGDVVKGVYGLKEAALIPLLVEAIKEQQKEIEALKATVASMQGKTTSVSGK
jgi:hypothetical protein